MAAAFDKAARQRFLRVIRKDGSIDQAARAAGVSRQAVYYHRARDARFAEAWDRAMPARPISQADLKAARCIAERASRDEFVTAMVDRLFGPEPTRVGRQAGPGGTIR